MNNPEIDDILQVGFCLEKFSHGRDADVDVILSSGSGYVVRRAKLGKEQDFLRESRVLEFLGSKTLTHIPRFIGRTEMGGIPVVMLEYVPGEPLGNRETLEGVKWEPIIDGMIDLNTIYSTEGTWGKMLSSDLNRGNLRSFREYLDQQYIGKIVVSSFLHQEDVQRINKKIEEILTKIGDISDTKRPTIIHGDANPWNIVVDEHKNAKWIDLGSARYSLPEEDIARLGIFELTRGLTTILADQYRQKAGKTLNMELIKLFRLCIVAKRLSKKGLEPWEQEWKNVLAKLLK